MRQVARQCGLALTMPASGAIVSAMSRYVLTTMVTACLFAADPTFLRRRARDVRPQSDDLTRNASEASYKPLLGTGDAEAKQLKEVAQARCCTANGRRP